MACLIDLGGIHLNKNNIIKSILSTLVVVGILLITGLYYWLIFSQAKDFTFIITIIMTSIISAVLVLFVYNLMLKIKPKDTLVKVQKDSIQSETKIDSKTETLKIEDYKSESDDDDYIDVSSFSKNNSSKSSNKTSENADSQTVITV